MPHPRSRLFGSGYTMIFFGGPQRAIPISFVQMYNETTPRLVSDARPIQPIDWAWPAEIMTAKAMGEGTIEVDLIESWSEQAWNRLAPALAEMGGKARGGSTSSDTILDVVRAIDNSEGQIYVAKMIATPQTSSETEVGHARRTVMYMGAKITDIADGDQNVDVTTMEQTKRITFMYTHRIFQYQNVGGQGLRNFTPPIPQAQPFQQGGPNLHTVV